LCKFFKVNPDDMGRVDILNRILNGILVTIMSLVLFDWLSIRMNMACKFRLSRDYCVQCICEWIGFAH